MKFRVTFYDLDNAILKALFEETNSFFRHLEIRNDRVPRKSHVQKYYDYKNMFCKNDNIIRCSRYNFWYLFILFNHNCFCLSIQNKHKYIINTEFL